MRIFSKSICAVGSVVLCLPLSLAAAEPFPERPKFNLQSADGNSSLQFNFVAQMRWDYLYIDQGPVNDRTSSSKLLFRRIRTLLRGSLISPDLTYSLQVNWVPGLFELDDLTLGYRIHPQFQATVGQYKIPFTRHRLNSFTDLSLPEWGIETPYFGAERQLGVMFHNGADKPPQFEYEFGVFDGVNARASNAIGIPKTYAEPVPNPSNIVSPGSSRDNMHTELVLHAAYNYGGINVRQSVDTEGGPFRFSTGLSAAWDLKPTALQDHRFRMAPEVLMKLYGFSFEGVFYFTLFDEQKGERRTYMPGMLGGLLQASYFFLERYEVILRYVNVSLLEALRDDARHFADDQIAAASPADRPDVEKRYATTRKLETEHELELGFAVYLYGQALKWQTALGYLAHERTDGTRQDARLRTQIQIAF